MAGTTCYRGCGVEIKFDKNQRSQSGKMIPLEMNGEPHQCPKNKYNQQVQQTQPTQTQQQPAIQQQKYQYQLTRETRSPKQFDAVLDEEDEIIREQKKFQVDLIDISKKTLEAIENLNISIQAFLHKDDERPTVQKASELVARSALEKASELMDTSAYEQNKAWDNVDKTIQDLGLSEDRVEESDNEDEDPTMEGRQ